MSDRAKRNDSQVQVVQVQLADDGRTPGPPMRVVVNRRPIALTCRDRVVSKLGSMAYAPQPTSLESAVDDAVEVAFRDAQDVVVWWGDRVAAVAVRSEDGRVSVTPFIDPEES